MALHFLFLHFCLFVRIAVGHFIFYFYLLPFCLAFLGLPLRLHFCFLRTLLYLLRVPRTFARCGLLRLLLLALLFIFAFLRIARLARAHARMRVRIFAFTRFACRTLADANIFARFT